MRLLTVLILAFFFNNCSFDDKSGIWKNENFNSSEKKAPGSFDGFEKLSTESDIFDKVLPIESEYRINFLKPETTNSWNDIFFSKSNNSKNFSFSEKNQINFRSKKVTKHNINEYILFADNNVITSDEKGNLIVFSTTKNKIIVKFNFYKKKYKKFKKYLNLYVENNLVYVSDNLGYLYAYDFEKSKVIWAKNYKIPFRGNLKIFKNKLITSDQNNSLYIFDKLNGEVIRLIPTEETIIKNEFKNNISIFDNNLFFINTFGSIYSINLNNLSINWFINLNETVNLNPGNLFDGSEIVSSKNKILVSSEYFTYVLDSFSGSIIYKVNFSSQTRPILFEDHLFLITRNNLLLVMNLANRKIIFSSDINQDISNYLNIKKYSVKIKSLNILQNQIYIFLKNSYYIKYNLSGKIDYINKLPSKINSQLIFINNKIAFLDFKNKINLID